MGYTTSARNSMLTTFGASALFASLHSAYPGNAGASEIAGGTPPYARQPVTWGASASGQMTTATNPTFNVPASTSISWVGLWSLITGGTFLCSLPIGGNAGVPFYVAAGDDTLRADNHGLTDGTQVVVLDTNIGVLPTGLTEGTVYFVRDTSGDTFKLAATLGGSAIDLTSDGTGFITPIVPETFGGQGTYAVSTITVDLLR